MMRYSIYYSLLKRIVTSKYFESVIQKASSNNNNIVLQVLTSLGVYKQDLKEQSEKEAFIAEEKALDQEDIIINQPEAEPLPADPAGQEEEKLPQQEDVALEEVVLEEVPELDIEAQETLNEELTTIEPELVAEEALELEEIIINPPEAEPLPVDAADQEELPQQEDVVQEDALHNAAFNEIQTMIVNSKQAILDAVHKKDYTQVSKLLLSIENDLGENSHEFDDLLRSLIIKSYELRDNEFAQILCKVSDEYTTGNLLLESISNQNWGRNKHLKDRVKFLLENGADPYYLNGRVFSEGGGSAFYIASTSGDQELMAILLKEGYIKHNPDKFNRFLSLQDPQHPLIDNENLYLFIAIMGIKYHVHNAAEHNQAEVLGCPFHIKETYNDINVCQQMKESIQNVIRDVRQQIETTKALEERAPLPTDVCNIIATFHGGFELNDVARKGVEK